MEDGEVRSINLIATEHVSGQQPPVAARSKIVDLMSRCVSPQHVASVDVVGVCRASARVVRCEPEVIEILAGRDDRARGEQGFVPRQLIFNCDTQYAERMLGLPRQVTIEPLQYGCCHVGRRVTNVAPRIDHDCTIWGSRRR